MPIYEYQCAACGRVVEKWQKISEAPLTTCQSCGGNLSKIISNCSFHLKGGGWYVTDYSGSRSGAADNSTSEATQAASGSESPAPAGEGKTETAAPPKKIT